MGNGNAGMFLAKTQSSLRGNGGGDTIRNTIRMMMGEYGIFG
jgi:hypothetical protein